MRTQYLEVRTITSLRRLEGILLAALLLPALVCGGATRYVARHGSNAAGDGSQASPWATIQYSVTNAQSGDTILIGEGLYTENVALTNTIHTLTIKGGHSTNDWSWNPSIFTTTIRGKIVLGSPLSTSNMIAGLMINGNGGYGVEVPYHGTAKGNVTISHCIVTNTSWGIYSEAQCDVSMFNTVVAKSSQGGSYLNGGSGPAGTNFFDHCTFVTNKRANIWVPNGGKTIIRNTIAYGAYGTGGHLNEGYGVAVGTTADKSAIISHSLVYGNTVNTNGLVSFGDGMITGQAPLFVAYATGDYRLDNGSPCVNAGVTIPAITDDLDLNPRPWGVVPFYDIGAYEAFGPSTVPAAPTGLVAVARSAFRIDLGWTDNADDETGFQIERKMEGGSWTTLASVEAGATAYADEGLLSETRYDYRVRAWNTVGTSDWSGEAGALTPPPPPSAPSGLVATATSAFRVDLVWQHDGIRTDGIRVERRTDTTGAWMPIAALAAGVSNHTDTGVVAITRYDYRVRAWNAHGDSDWSNEARADTPPAPPTGLSATVVARQRIDLAWTAGTGSGADFEIERAMGTNGMFTRIGTVSGASSYARAVLLDRPTAYFRLGEPDLAGGLRDQANPGQPPGVFYGTPVAGAPGAIAGDGDTAVRFDGQTAWALATDTIAYIQIKASFSVEVWVRSATPMFETLAWFVSRRIPDGFIFGPDVYMDNGQLKQRVSAWVIDSQGRTDASLRYPLAPGFDVSVWHHYVFAYEAAVDSATLYIDGDAVMTKPRLLGDTGGWRSPSARINLVIGRDDGMSGRFGNGWLDEVAVYDYPLTAEQVGSHFNLGHGE